MLEPILMTRWEARGLDALFRCGAYEYAAKDLGIAIGTLHCYVSSVCHKAGVRSLLKLLALAYRNGGYLY